MLHPRLLLPWLVLVLAFPRVLAAAEAVDVHVFWRVGCPHCEHELAWLESLQARDPQVRVRLYEVGKDPRNRQLLGELAGKLETKLAVPFTVIGGDVVVGWWDAAPRGRGAGLGLLAVVPSGGRCGAGGDRRPHVGAPGVVDARLSATRVAYPACGTPAA